MRRLKLSKPGPEAKYRGEEAKEAACALSTCSVSLWLTNPEGDHTCGFKTTNGADGIDASALDRQSAACKGRRNCRNARDAITPSKT